MICKCGGLLFVKSIEEPPIDLPKHKKLIYNRTCDVECIKCGRVYYSQPYDFGKGLNLVKNNKDDTD